MSEVEPAPLWGGTSYPFSITFHPGLARVLEHAGYGSATTKAIILSRIHDLLPTSPFIRDGVPWVGNSHEHWRADHFPFLSVAGVKTLFKKLEQDGLLIPQKRGRTNPVAYRPNYPKLAELQANEPEKLVANEQIKVVIGKQEPPTSAPAEQSAPQTTPTPAEPTQDVTAAHVEQEGTQEAGGATAPTRTPASAPLQLGSMTFHHASKHNLSPRMFYRPTSDEPQFITWEGDEIWKCVNCRTEEFVRAVRACTGGFIDLEAPPEMKVWVDGTNVIFYVPPEELADYRKLLQGYA